MRIEDIQPGRTYPSRIGGEPFTVRQVQPEAGLYAGYVGYTRGNDNAMRSVTPADFIEMARLPDEPHVPPGPPSELAFTPAEATYLRECIARDPRGLPSIGPLNEKLFALGGAYARYDPVPIPMILHCPCCGMQHVDAEDRTPWPPVPPGVQIESFSGEAAGGALWSDGVTRYPKWPNPPHRSHMCQYCRTVWRPADVPTTGVAAITTRGRDDTPAFATAGNRPPTERVATIGECASVDWEQGGPTQLPPGAILVAILPRR